MFLFSNVHGRLMESVPASAQTISAIQQLAGSQRECAHSSSSTMASDLNQRAVTAKICMRPRIPVAGKFRIHIGNVAASTSRQAWRRLWRLSNSRDHTCRVWMLPGLGSRCEVRHVDYRDNCPRQRVPKNSLAVTLHHFQCNHTAILIGSFL